MLLGTANLVMYSQSKDDSHLARPGYNVIISDGDTLELPKIQLQVHELNYYVQSVQSWCSGLAATNGGITVETTVLKSIPNLFSCIMTKYT